MEEMPLSSWAEFKSAIDEIRRKHGYQEYDGGDGQSIKVNNTVLFRGQQDSNWKLETTLERKTQDAFSISDYYGLILQSVYELESYTGIKWGLSELKDIVAEIKENQSRYQPFLPNYDYLVYLRHHGYPSPLLDWTESPYIAAYFALCETPLSESSAIYSYIEMPTGSKFLELGEPGISLQSPMVRTDKRHFTQKAWYTVATQWSNDEHIFCSHHKIFDMTKQNRRTKQDILIKITIPSKCRKEVLLELNDYNINHFTLFQSEDALVKTLSIKDFDISNGGMLSR